MVRLNRTFFNYIITGETRCVGYLYTSSGWFNRIEPHRTFWNHFITEKTRCVVFFHMSLDWFNHVEPSVTSSNNFIEEKTSCAETFHMSSGWFNYTVIKLLYQRENKVCRALSHEFGMVRLYRTFSTYIFTWRSRCVWYLYASSGWFNRIEPPRTFLNHFIVEKTWCVKFFLHGLGIVRDGSTMPNLL